MMDIGIGIQIDQQNQNDSSVLYLITENGNHIIDKNNNYIII